MSRRPRIVVLASNSDRDSALQTLAQEAELVRAATPEEGIQLLLEGGCEGVVAFTPKEGMAGFSSEAIVARIAAGIAIIDNEFRIQFFNPAFSAMCDGTPAIGARIYDAIGCEEIEGPDFCPFIDCIGGAASAHTQLRLASGRRLEIVVQAFEPQPIRLLCLVRDITSEVKQREKLIAIHRAGLELSHLRPDELDRMSTAERIDLLKANIIQYSQRILHFKNVEIRLLDPRTRKLKVLLSEGMTAQSELRELVAETHNNGVTGFVAASGTSYLCDDVLHDPLYIPGALDARSSMTVPIIYRDQVIGTFNVESPEPRHFTESDREFLEVFAREIAVALNTLELLQAEKRFGGTKTVEAINDEVGLPVDEIIADALRLLEYLNDPEKNKDRSHDVLRRVLVNSRSIKSSIQKVGRHYDPVVESMAGPGDAKGSFLAGRRVLLVDNDPGIRRSAHSMLGRTGAEVDTAKDGAEAMTMIRTIGYEVILGDIRLPDMDGYEFFTRARQISPNAPIVLMTGFGYDPTHSLVKARQEGLKTVLYKPFRFERLREAIEDALDPQRAQGRSGRPIRV